MTFAKCLNAYLEELGCTASELSDAAGISKSTISRYLSGQRQPAADSANVQQLAAALASVERAAAPGAAHSYDVLDEATIRAELVRALQQPADATQPALFPERLELVLDTFGVARNRLARSMDFDPSYISRILAGQRRPADMTAFIDGVAAYIARNHGDTVGIALAADLTGTDPAALASPFELANAIKHFLGSDEGLPPNNPDAIDAFLVKLDEFDLNDFMKEIRFDELKVPTVPFQLPTTKTYSGIEEMKQAEIDFLKAAALAKSTDDVILYSDMPLGEMAQDEEFPKKIMFGMAMLVRKGIHLHNIHDVHRPLNELFMGMEGWIPVYMTGQITPYYLPQPTNSTFLHFIRSAGTVAVSGEAIAGNQGGGRYVVTKNANDVAYLRRRAQELLAHAKPLLRVFHEHEDEKLKALLNRLEKQVKTDAVEVGGNTFSNMRIRVWPKSHAVIEKANAPKVTMVVEYPALVDALERYEPTLFEHKE